MKKITLATIKSFIRKSGDKLLIRKINEFNPLHDGIMPCDDQGYTKAEKAEETTRYNLGISGAWFVWSSRNYFFQIDTPKYYGYQISNCCGTFDLAVEK